MVASTLLVQQDLSGTAFGGTFVPTDVTRFVRLVDGVSINNWRQDAASQISPSTLSLTFDNDAIPGDATAPNAGRFTPGLSSSPWTGKILPGVRTRITETVGGTTYQLFDGYVLDWTAQAGGDDGTFPVVLVSCTDALGWMSQLQPLYSIVVEETLLDSPNSLHLLDESQGSTSGGDLRGGRPAVATDSKYGAGSATFGGTTSIVGQGGSVTFDSPDYGSLGNNLRATWLETPNLLPASGAWTLEWWFQGPTTVPTVTGYMVYQNGRPAAPTFAGSVGVAIDQSGGRLSWTVWGSAQLVATGPRNVCDGLWHHAVLVYAADGKSASLYLDGVLDSTATNATDIGWTNLNLRWALGAARLASITSTGNPFKGSMALFAQYTGALSTARIAAHYTAGLNAFAGERTDQHAARLLGYRPNTGSVLDTGKGIIGPHATTGLSLTQALLDTAKAEGGLVFADGQGRVVLLNRAHLYDPAVAATLDAEADITSDYQARIDTQLLVNDMTIGRADGADQRVVDVTSKTTYGWRQQSDTYLVNSDRDAVDAAGWLVANQKTASVRTPSIAVDITTMTSTSQAQAALARQPLDRMSLSNLPSWAPPTDVVVQGRGVRIDDGGLSLAFFTSPLARKTLRADAAASANTKLDNGLVIPW